MFTMLFPLKIPESETLRYVRIVFNRLPTIFVFFFQKKLGYMFIHAPHSASWHGINMTLGIAQ